MFLFGAYCIIYNISTTCYTEILSDGDWRNEAPSSKQTYPNRNGHEVHGGQILIQNRNQEILLDPHHQGFDDNNRPPHSDSRLTILKLENVLVSCKSEPTF